MMISTVRNSFHDTLVNWLDEVFISDILVSSSGRIITADVQSTDESVLKDLSHVKGIRPIELGRGAGIKFSRISYHGDTVVIKAFDHSSSYYQNRNYKVAGSDRFSTVEALYQGDDPKMLASENFLRKYKFKVGESVLLDTPSGATPFKIIGKVVDYASPNGVFYLNRATFKRLWKDSTLTSFQLNLAPGFTFEQAKANIDQALGQNGI